MQDNEAFALFVAQFQPALVAAGFATVKVKQSNTPGTIGADTGPTLYLSKIADRPRGFPKRSSAPQLPDYEMVHTETQKFETTFQATAILQQPEGPTVNTRTASDLANFARLVVAGDGFRAALKALDCGVLAPTDIRNPYELNGGDQFEAFPSFDFVLTHDRKLVTVVPAIVGPPELIVSRV